MSFQYRSRICTAVDNLRWVFLYFSMAFLRLLNRRPCRNNRYARIAMVMVLNPVMGDLWYVYIYTIGMLKAYSVDNAMDMVMCCRCIIWAA